MSDNVVIGLAFLVVTIGLVIIIVVGDGRLGDRITKLENE